MNFDSPLATTNAPHTTWPASLYQYALTFKRHCHSITLKLNVRVHISPKMYSCFLSISSSVFFFSFPDPLQALQHSFQIIFAKQREEKKQMKERNLHIPSPSPQLSSHAQTTCVFTSTLASASSLSTNYIRLHPPSYSLPLCQILWQMIPSRLSQT